MFRDLTLTVAIETGNRHPTEDDFPTYPDPAVVADLINPGKGCAQYAPGSPFPGFPPYACSRSPQHDGPHVAGLDVTTGRHIAEWDDDRTTDAHD